MQLSMPNLPEALAYSVVSAFALTVLAALVTAATGPWDLVAAVLVLAIAGGIYWLIGRQPATIVTAKQAAATGAILLALCALADLATVYPYQGILFLFAAAALAVAFVLLQQGTRRGDRVCWAERRRSVAHAGGPARRRDPDAGGIRRETHAGRAVKHDPLQRD
jgi:hypothetical protein